MSFEPEHELHKRRLGRNLGLGASLLAFVIIVFAVTIVKVKDAPHPGKAMNEIVNGGKP